VLIRVIGVQSFPGVSTYLQICIPGKPG